MRFRCWIGRHDYVRRVVGGETYRVCTACGKETEPPDHWGATRPGGEGLRDGSGGGDPPGDGGD
jgi:hypothetical protein